MKKVIASFVIIILLSTLAGCQTSQVDLKLTSENYPRIDGSTANIPLAHLLAMRFLNMSQEEAEAYVQFNTTPSAYYNLLFDDCDLVLAYEPSDYIRSCLEEDGMSLDFYEIGIDALVFIVNVENPVESLTQKQIVDIYAGNIRDWEEVGGQDLSIEAFQRSQGSGSQNLMKKLVMKDQPMMVAPHAYYISDMMGLIDIIDDYSNESNAIGYTVYYYATYMYTKSNLKLLAVDGVMPSNDTIASGEYPYVHPFYAVVRSDEPQDSPARQLAEWLTTTNGKALMKDAGYVPTE